MTKYIIMYPEDIRRSSPLLLFLVSSFERCCTISILNLVKQTRTVLSNSACWETGKRPYNGVGLL